MSPTRRTAARSRSGSATRAQTRALAQHRRTVVGQLRTEIGVPAEPAGAAAVVMLMGFPGSGKSHCARLLAARLGAAHVATDHLRARLFIAPSYAAEENHAVFGIAEALVEDLLAEGHRVIVDATNLVARNRAPLERLARRGTARGTGDHSDADIGVYERMRVTGFEPPASYVELRNGPELEVEIERVTAVVRDASGIAR